MFVGGIPMPNTPCLVHKKTRVFTPVSAGEQSWALSSDPMAPTGLMYDRSALRSYNGKGNKQLSVSSCYSSIDLMLWHLGTCRSTAFCRHCIACRCGVKSSEDTTWYKQSHVLPPRPERDRPRNRTVFSSESVALAVYMPTSIVA